MEATVDLPKNENQSIVMPMVLAGSMFFILGCITWLNGAITPFLQQMLELSALQASFIISSFYIAVTIAGIPSAMLIRKVGYKNGMAIGCAVMASSALLYIPAAKLQMFRSSAIILNLCVRRRQLPSRHGRKSSISTTVVR